MATKAKPKKKTARSKKETIGFIGLGMMGGAFSANLIADGYPMVGTDPDRSAAARFRKMGGTPLASPREVAEAADIVFLSLPNSKLSLRVARGKNGFLACDEKKRPKVIIDTTTADPEDTRLLAQLCGNRRLDFLDACVSGHSQNVKVRLGLFLVGGEARVHRKVKPLLGQMLSDQMHCGPVGSGATMKVLINYLNCLMRCGIAETLRMGLRGGVKGDLLYDALTRSAADSRQLRNRGQKMLAEDFKNPVSTIDVLTKDIKLGMKLAHRSGSLVPVGKSCLPAFTEAQRSGYGDLDSAAVYKVYLDREKKRKNDPRWH